VVCRSWASVVRFANVGRVRFLKGFWLVSLLNNLLNTPLILYFHSLLKTQTNRCYWNARKSAKVKIIFSTFLPNLTVFKKFVSFALRIHPND
jgi:hypothetical protein